MKFRTIPRPFWSLVFQYLPCGRPPPEYRHRTCIVCSITRLGQQARRRRTSHLEAALKVIPAGSALCCPSSRAAPLVLGRALRWPTTKRRHCSRTLKHICIHCHSLGALFAGGLIEVRDKVFPLSCRAGWWWMESSTSPTVIFLRHLQSPVDDFQTPNNRHLQPL
jgi:hypothetical protein